MTGTVKNSPVLHAYSHHLKIVKRNPLNTYQGVFRLLNIRLCFRYEVSL